MSNSISGFSKLSKSEKINWIAKRYFLNQENAKQVLKQYWNTNKSLQKLHDEFIENTLSNFYLPFGVAPNFLINKQLYVLPMAIEESSVVAAASKSAKYWYSRGGFTAEVVSMKKVGQVHFIFDGNAKALIHFFEHNKAILLQNTLPITKNMRQRGGGILNIELIDKTEALHNYYQLHVTFNTLDAMGANFINSCLEQIAKTLKIEAEKKLLGNLNIIMSILSNYVPECLVTATVSCPVESLKSKDIPDPETFAKNFKQAVEIAEIEPYRAVTHNKGIMNGIDALVLATGNDFRAIEACAHAYASKNGQYKSLTHCSIQNNTFKFWIEIPLALGTVGGLTRLHPLAKFALELLQNPSAEDLMKIAAVAGLAQNFAALKSLTTRGIQQGHMKMHLLNIINQLGATDSERQLLIEHFKTNIVSYSSVVEALKNFRK